MKECLSIPILLDSRQVFTSPSLPFDTPENPPSGRKPLALGRMGSGSEQEQQRMECVGALAREKALQVEARGEKARGALRKSDGILYILYETVGHE